jgi:hypothetical protein
MISDKGLTLILQYDYSGARLNAGEVVTAALSAAPPGELSGGR